MSDTSPPPLWTEEDLAKHLGFSPATIRAMCCRDPKRLPPRLTTTSKYRWVPSVVERWLVEQSGRPVVRKAGRPRLGV